MIKKLFTAIVAVVLFCSFGATAKAVDKKNPYAMIEKVAKVTFKRFADEQTEIQKNPNILKSGRHGNEFYVDMWNSLLESKVWSGELWNKRKNGEIFPELVTISAVSDINNKTQNY